MTAPSEVKTEHKSQTVLVIVGSLSAVLIGLITNARPYLESVLYNVVVAGFAMSILALVAFYFVVRPLWPIISKWRTKKLRGSLARRLWPELTQLVSRFAEIAESRYAVGIHRAMGFFQIAGQRVDEHQARITQDIMGRLLNFYNPVISDRLQELQSDINESTAGKSFFLFRHFLYEFWYLIMIHKSVFMDSYVDLCKRIGEDAVYRLSREEYMKFLAKYNQFVVSFSDLGKRVNQIIGERQVPDYLQDATPLRL